MFPTSPAHQSSASAITGPICLSWTTSIRSEERRVGEVGKGGFFRGPWYLCFSRDIFMFVPLLTERRSDGLCLLDHQPSTSGRCCRKLLSMNSAVPKLGSKDSSTEHPCSRLHQLTNRVQALLPAQFA